MNIALTGSHGLIGSALARHLESLDHCILRLVRRAPENPREIEWNPESDEPILLPEDTDAVIHLAGANISQRWTKRHKDLICSSRIEATQKLCAQLASSPSPPRVFLCASAIGVYGEGGNHWLTEESAIGEGFLAQVCRDWEDATRVASEAGIRVVNLRLGIVLSARGGALKKMLPAFRLCLGGRLGEGRQYWSWVSLHDATRAITFILEHEELRGPINITAPQPETNFEFTRTLSRVLARPALLPVPAFALRLALGEMAEKALLSSARVHPKKLEKAGYVFRHRELEKALHDLVR